MRKKTIWIIIAIVFVVYICLYFPLKGPLYYAVEHNDAKKIKIILTFYPQMVNSKNEYWEPLLNIAAGKSSPETVKLLLSKGANINVPDWNGYTPWSVAWNRESLKESKESKEIIKLFIDAGIDVNQPVYGLNYSSALHIAAQNGDKELAETLISKGANITKTSYYELAPLDIAIIYGQNELIDLLISKGAKLDIKIKDFRGNTLLYNTIVCDNRYYKKGMTDFWKSKKEMVEWLISKGADVNQKNEGGCTALHLAAERRNAEIIRQLIKSDARVNEKDNWGRTALHFAGASKYSGDFLGVASLLISNGANVNAKDNNGVTPLHYAAGYGGKELIEYLISKGADVNAKDNNGSTPLHYAAGYANDEAAKLLIAKGVNINAKDNNGKTPLNLAKKHAGDTKIVEILQKAGAK